MKIAVLKEAAAHERRVPIVPDSVKRLGREEDRGRRRERRGGARALERRRLHEGGRDRRKGRRRHHRRGRHGDAPSRAHAGRGGAPEGRQRRSFAPLLPLVNHDLVKALAARKITSFAVDFIPRTTVAQMMDVLSSQAHRRRLLRRRSSPRAALPRFFPMLMTAAGTIAPATRARPRRRRRGPPGHRHRAPPRRASSRRSTCARSSRSRSRASARSSSRSTSDEDAQTAGGYAKEVSEEYKKKQAEALARARRQGRRRHHHRAHPRQARAGPRHRRMVKAMKPGLGHRRSRRRARRQLRAAPRPGKTVVKHGVTIIGAVNLPEQPRRAREPDVVAQHGEAHVPPVTKDGALKLDIEGRDHARLRHHARAARSCTQRVREALGRAQEGELQRERRARLRSLHLRAGDVRRLPGHLARPAAPAHAAHVRHERHQRHLARRLARRGRLAARPVSSILGFIAVTAATINVVGGFMITDRMLRMFKKGPPRAAADARGAKALIMHDTLINLAYLVASILFILCLRGLSLAGAGAARHLPRRARHAHRRRRRRSCSRRSSATTGSSPASSSARLIGTAISREASR